MNPLSRTWRLVLFLAAIAGVPSCASPPKEPTFGAETNSLAEFARTRRAEDGAAAPTEAPPAETADAPIEPVVKTLSVPQISSPQEVEDGAESSGEPPRSAVSTVDAVVPPLALPAFIDIVFGEMLKVPYVTGDGVAQRDDVIQLRSSGTMNAETFLALVTDALREYGVEVVPENGAYRIVESAELLARMPVFIKSRARRETPSALRPVVQFVELSAIGANEMVEILTQAFRQNQQLTYTANPNVNSVTLTGLPEDVNAALGLIAQFDDLAYAGTEAIRYSPVYWNSTDLSAELLRVMRAEGWQIADNPLVPRTILALPIKFSNDLLVFARSRPALQRARFWLSELDRPARMGDAPQLFVYEVENVDAEILATTANAILSGGTSATGPGSQAIVDPSAAANGAPAGPGASQNGLVVDKLSNRLIFSGTASDYERLFPVLRQLDRAPAEVLIEVTVAEITLTDDTRYGIEFFIDQLSANRVAWSLGNQGLGLGSGGVDVAIIHDDFDVALNFFASNDRIKVLSTPRLIARSGASASIQVGSDVPIITSQRASDQQSGSGDLDILQSVDYRKTGVLLEIEPIVLGQNRIDLTLTQEVSTTLDATSGGIASPTISNRSLTTQLSLEDGATAILGGLIQENVSRGQTGAPLLKDIPLIGRAFRTDSVTRDRTELIVLITAYIIRDAKDRERFVRELVDEFDRSAAQSGEPETYLPDRP